MSSTRAGESAGARLSPGSRRWDLISQIVLGGAALMLAVTAYVLLVHALIDYLPADSLPLALSVTLLGLPLLAATALIGARVWQARQRQTHGIRQLLAAIDAPDAAAHPGGTSWLSRVRAGPEERDVLTAIARSFDHLSSLHAATRAMLLDRDTQLDAMRSLGGQIYWETDTLGRYTRLELPDRGRRPEIAHLLGRSRWDDGACPVEPGTDWEAHRAVLQRREHFSGLVVRRRAFSGTGYLTWESGEPRFGPDGGFLGYGGVMRELIEANDPGSVHRPGAAAGTAPHDASGQVPRLQDIELVRQELESFGYTVSHDLRAPLRAVEGFARIIQEDYGQSLDRVGHDHLNRILSAAQRMNAMIDALLSLSRLTSQPVRSVPLDLSRLAAEVADELRANDPGRQVRFDIDTGLTVHGDPALLRVVMDNLLGNAWKYTSARPMAHIRFEARWAPIDAPDAPDTIHAPGTSAPAAAAAGRLRTDGSSARIVYCVRDDGVGFDMRFADRLFKVFQRLHSASDYPGSGIGLATVQRIVQRHDGRIWVESSPGEGTAFYFTLWDPQARPKTSPISLH